MVEAQARTVAGQKRKRKGHTALPQDDVGVVVARDYAKDSVKGTRGQAFSERDEGTRGQASGKDGTEDGMMGKKTKQTSNGTPEEKSVGVRRNAQSGMEKNGYREGKRGMNGYGSRQGEITAVSGGGGKGGSGGLPIAAHREEIVSAVNRHPVVVLTGETGSGKSTQVPQYLLSRTPSAGGRKLKIAVTQPRRVAATSLAKRVATEMRSPLGKTPKARVGYSVRFDSNVGRDNEIVYVTEGMLLMELLRDPGLTQYGVVVVDEVHERGVDVDLLLGFLKGLVKGEGEGAKKRKEKKVGELRVVVMSATVEVEGLMKFFGHDEDEIQSSDVKGQENTGQETKEAQQTPSGHATNGANGNHDQPATLVKVEGRQYPVHVNYLPEPVQDFTEAALKTIFQIHCKEPMPGDVLVFMTGQETIQGLQRNIEEYAQSLGPEYPKLLVLPIYAALPQAAQQRVFEPAPPNTRKVILATNIAETSITVPGVRFVVDSGKEKRKQFRPKLGLESLLVKSVSKSSAIQRKGRAGREAPGKCFRLYTERDYTSLDQTKNPEILRCDLADAVLKMKATGISDVLSFPLLTPPSREAMARSLLHLLHLDALESTTGEITPLGRAMSRFPLSPSYGRVLLAAADEAMDCLLPVIDIISCFSADNTVFLNTDTEEAREEAALSRAALLRRQGDHLTLLAVVQAYAAEQTDRKSWCHKRFVSHRAMSSIMDIRKQLRAQCVSQRLLTQNQVVAYDEAANASTDEKLAENVLRCFLRGFRQNTARLMPDGSYRTFVGSQNVAVHPSSVLFGRKVEAIIYAEFVFTNRTYARGVGVVQNGWVGEVFGGS
ncbi:Helicase associated domain (HA2)-containing protein 3 [Elsinoe fawcettii]|nr:Helicase associated domain (HA2)-containing protein 3 [Elsinoe fawcettii]